MTARGDDTRALAQLDGGNAESPEALLPLVYDDLRRLAGRYFQDEPADQTLQPTALVHEVWLRLNGAPSPRNRVQFLSTAARTMRHLLIDHARRRRAAMRGGGCKRVSLEEAADRAADRDAYLVALDDALRDLAGIDGELCRVIELRFFGGLSVEETAQVLGLSPATVKRRWTLAKGWLHRQIIAGDLP